MVFIESMNPAGQRIPIWGEPTGQINGVTNGLQNYIGRQLDMFQVPNLARPEEPLSLHAEMRHGETERLHNLDPTFPVNTQPTMSRAKHNRLHTRQTTNFFSTQCCYKNKIMMIGGVATVVGITYLYYRSI